MTWAQDQRIAFIKERIDAGERVNRADLREKFYISLQSATSTFHEFERRYPGMMRYCARTKAMVPAAWVPDGDVAWKARAEAAEQRNAELTAALENISEVGQVARTDWPDNDNTARRWFINAVKRMEDKARAALLKSAPQAGGEDHG